MLSKIVLLILSVLLMGATSCAHGLHVKIYYLDESQGGLVRKQANEVLPFKDATGYYCVSPSDFEIIEQVCKARSAK